MAEISRLPGPNAELWEWQLRGACRTVSSDLFFHPEGERGPSRRNRELAAKQVCARCPVLASAARTLSRTRAVRRLGRHVGDEREVEYVLHKQRLAHLARRRPSVPLDTQE